jgi:hypothetical protein
VEIQRQAEVRNRPVHPRDQIRLRIGINVADILIDEQDIAGGGVNLAARLETLARPGGICISQALKEQIQEDLGVEFVERSAFHHRHGASSGAAGRGRWWCRAGCASGHFRAGSGLRSPCRWRSPPSGMVVGQSAEQENLDKLSVTVLPFRSASSIQRLANWRACSAPAPGAESESNMLSVKGLATEALPDANGICTARRELKTRYALVGEVTQSGPRAGWRLGFRYGVEHGGVG